MKNKIRKEKLALRNAMSDNLLEEKSKIIAQKIITHTRYQQAELLFCYVNTRSEVKTEEIIRHAWKTGKKVAVPKVHGDVMKFYLITDFKELELGSFGIMEPKETCKEVINVPTNSIVIMPGVAFDRDRNRIGYGKGYYDKYFAQYADMYKIAIAFSAQIVPKIPADEFDISVDCVITEELL